MQSMNVSGTRSGTRTAISLAALLSCALAGSAWAMEIETGNPDNQLRFDTTVRYNLGVRTQGQDAAITANPNYNDGDLAFGKGRLTTNRLDLLSELDFVMHKEYGFRVSAAAWADAAYHNLPSSNNPTPNTLVNGVPTAGALSPTSRFYSEGPAGEFLDAFIFANTNVADMPVNVKAGRHTTFWGESLMLGGAVHGVSYGQYSIDLQKALANPGASLKELFRPRNSLTVQVQPTTDLAIAAQTFFQWESVRYPEAGSYLSVGDMLLEGGDSLVTPLGYMTQNNGSKPRNMGDWGVNAHWSPAWLDGTAGLYLRQTADIQPQIAAAPGFLPPPLTCAAVGGGAPLSAAGGCIINPAAANNVVTSNGGLAGQYGAYYGRDIDILGLSLSKEVGGVSVGGELSVRHNMPLVSVPVYLYPSANLAGMQTYVSGFLAPTLAGLQAKQAQVSAQLAAAQAAGAPAAVITALTNGLAAIKAGEVQVGTGIATIGALTTGAATVPAGSASYNGDTPGAKGNTAHGVLSLIGSINKTPLFDTLNWQAEFTWNRWLSVTQNYAAFKGSTGYTSGTTNGAANIDAVTRDFFGMGLSIAPTWFQVLPSVDLSLPVSWSAGLKGASAVTSGGNAGAGFFSIGAQADVQSKYTFGLSYIGFYGNFSTSPATPGVMGVNNGTMPTLSDRGQLIATFKTTF